MNDTARPAKTTPFRVHLLSPQGEKHTIRLEASSPAAIQQAVREKLPGHLIQKVKVDRSGGANGR